MVGGQGFRVHHVQGGAQAAALQLGEQGVGVHHRAPGHVHHQGAVRQAGQEVRVHHAPGGVVERGDQDHDLRRRQQGRQLVHAVHMAVPVVPGAGADPGQLDAERRQPLGDGGAHATGADHQHLAVQQPRRGERPPDALRLVPGEVVQATLGGEDQPQGQFRRGAGVQPIGTGHGGAASRFDKAIIAGGLGLDQLEIGQGGQALFARLAGGMMKHHRLHLRLAQALGRACQIPDAQLQIPGLILDGVQVPLGGQGKGADVEGGHGKAPGA